MKRYRLTKKRKALLQSILLGAIVIGLMIWAGRAFWQAFIYGPQW